MPIFSITKENQVTVVEHWESPVLRFPRVLKVIRDLELRPYGTIKAGALCTTARTLDGVLELTFVDRWPALRQWDNILLLFPNCVDDDILVSLRAVPETPAGNVIDLWRTSASIAAVVASSVTYIDALIMGVPDHDKPAIKRASKVSNDLD